MNVFILFCICLYVIMCIYRSVFALKILLINPKILFGFIKFKNVEMYKYLSFITWTENVNKVWNTQMSFIFEMIWVFFSFWTDKNMRRKLSLFEWTWQSRWKRDGYISFAHIHMYFDTDASRHFLFIFFFFRMLNQTYYVFTHTKKVAFFPHRELVSCYWVKMH